MLVRSSPRRSRSRTRSRSRSRSRQRSRSKSRQRSRSRSRQRSRSRSSRRSRSSSRGTSVPPTVSATANVFTLSRSKSRVVRKWLVQGLSRDAAKSLRERYKPKFHGHFDLSCPTMDESIVRRWTNILKVQKLSDFQEKTFKSIQYQLLDAFRPLFHT